MKKLLIFLFLLIPVSSFAVQNKIMVGKSFEKYNYYGYQLQGDHLFTQLTAIGDGLFLGWGIHLDYRQWTIGSSIGKWSPGENSPDLGCPVEFFSFIEYRFSLEIEIDQSVVFYPDLSISIGHMSNAHLEHKNPGINIISLNFLF